MTHRTTALLAGFMLLAGASGAAGAEPGGANPAGGGVNDPAVRFHGAPTYDFGVTNVKWEVGTKDYSFVTFDLSWSFSWRQKWTEPAKTSVTGKDLEVENWDAAWVFVKFLPEKDSKESMERNHWRHATLASASADHVMPAGAVNTVKLSDDGTRGMGVFIYRDAIGHGVNDWKGIKLRWMHGADPSTGLGAGKVDPAKAAVAVHPIPMVYVPAGPFKLGLVVESGLSHFADGPDIPIVRYDGEQSFNELPAGLQKAIDSTRTDGGPYLRWEANPTRSCWTDGAWRGGITIPFLVDAEWSAPVASGPRARRVGPVVGQLWSTFTFSERSGSGGLFSNFSGHIGGVGAYSDDYPIGYDAFYCMKYDLTQGQYVDFLNSLPPDVAAGRAFVSHEMSSDAAMCSEEIKVDLGPGRGSYSVREVAGNTIRSSADVPASAGAPVAGAEGTEDRKDALDDLLTDAFETKKGKGKASSASPSRPVYMARCPFRRIPGIAGADTRAYAVWAGLRPMSQLEGVKAGVGARDPAAPADWAPPKDYDGGPVLLDAGLPTERFAKGQAGYGSDLATRVGCRATATSDRGAALATYWGISELGGPAITPASRGFRGTHGDGTTPAGTPGAPVKRGLAPFKASPPDWPEWDEYLGGRFVGGQCRLVVSADNRIKKPPVQTPAGSAVAKSVAPPANPMPRTDNPTITNVKWEAGTKDYSTVSFDLAWKNSWRAKWTEPAEKNVTGKPLAVESWDAAWVFVKFRPTGANPSTGLGAGDDLHATLSAQATDHAVPPGAALAVGLTDDGELGTGVFVYRAAVGNGPNDFKKIKLRWSHGDKVDPGKVELKVHALGMVYVPEGPFASRSPWGHALTVITTPEATKPGGHLESGTNSVPVNDEWPNGYPAFYCMKYSITQGQYVELLNSRPSGKYSDGRYGALADNNFRRFSAALYNFNGHTITTNAVGVYHADVPDRWCQFVSLPDILSFTAWAGLRPPTNLEYEKACRGPRAVARGADAWAPATCAPAVGLDKSVLGNIPAVGPGPSYWGIRELSLSGCVQEWPAAVIQNEPVHDGKGCGVAVRGLHGNGSPEVLEEWPWTCFGEWYYGGIWRLWAYGTVGHWFDTAEVSRIPWNLIDASRAGRYGARAVRTAPISTDVKSPLVLDPLPNLTGFDLAIVYLSGRFNNTSDKPLKLTLASTLPDVCFPEGGAARRITAAPKTVTPFKILTALSSQSAASAVRRGTWLPLRIESAGGEVLAQQDLTLRMGPPAGGHPVIESLKGGEVALRITNATPRAVAVAIRMAPAGIRMAETNRAVTVAAGAGARAAFPIPRQAFSAEGLCRIPYSLTIEKAAPQNGEAVVELRTVSRWWLSRQITTGPKLAGDDDGLTAGAGEGGPDFGNLVSLAGNVFQHATPPKGWEPASAGASAPLSKLGPLPSSGSVLLAATRVHASGDREAVIQMPRQSVKEGKPPEFAVLVWFNDTVVYDSRADAKDKPKPFRIRRAANTLLVECRSVADGAVTPADAAVQFNDAKDGKPVSELLFDVEKR